MMEDMVTLLLPSASSWLKGCFRAPGTVLRGRSACGAVRTSAQSGYCTSRWTRESGSFGTDREWVMLVLPFLLLLADGCWLDKSGHADESLRASTAIWPLIIITKSSLPQTPEPGHGHVTVPTAVIYRSCSHLPLCVSTSLPSLLVCPLRAVQPRQ